MRIGGIVRVCIGTVFSLKKFRSIYLVSRPVIAAAHGRKPFTITPIP
jgi:hypothetical protein